MHSRRFVKDVVITDHARLRMSERDIDEPLLADLIETGTVRRIGAGQMFIYKPHPDRHDNLTCAATVEEEYLVIKTVMVNWTLREQT